MKSSLQDLKGLKGKVLACLECDKTTVHFKADGGIYICGNCGLAADGE